MKKVRVGALGSSWVDEDEPGKVAGELDVVLGSLCLISSSQWGLVCGFWLGSDIKFPFYGA